MPIPASQLVNGTPGVLGAGGNAVNLNGLLLTTNPRIPIGTVLQFAPGSSVSNYFGPASAETAAAAVYFAGVTNSTALPGALLISQYPTTSVAAYLRGGSLASITLAQLNALSGSISVTINGTTSTASNISLAGATSFSNAAEIIGAGLGIEGSQVGTVTGSIGGTFTATASAAKVLTVSAVLTGSLQPGDVVSGTDGTNSLQAGTTIVSQLTGTTGGVGTYSISKAPTPSNLGSCTVTSLSTTLNVTVDASSSIASGDIISGTSITAGTYIVSQISGTTGGVGLYSISNAMTVASETVTVYTPAVTFDSIASAFVITSATTGATSTITYATGTLAASLFLQQANGAVTSQGSAAYTPSQAMNAIVAQTNNWASFTTLFDPDGGTGNANKLLFAAWTSQQNNRYWYVPWDTDINPTTTVPATSSLGYLLTANNYSGTSPIWESSDLHLAVLAMSWAASINFDETNGRSTMAFKGQGGISPSVTNGTVAQDLIANGYNFYGQYSLNGTLFTNFQPGTVSGPFQWADSYVNQIWMNANFSLALLDLLTTENSLPYNTAGYTAIASALAGPIAAAGTFGAWRAGVPLSASQVQQINAAAGVNVAGTVQSVGWYLQITPASPSTRNTRGSPTIIFWYSDGGSIQQINFSSILVQ